MFSVVVAIEGNERWLLALLCGGNGLFCAGVWSAAQYRTVCGLCPAQDASVTRRETVGKTFSTGCIRSCCAACRSIGRIRMDCRDQLHSDAASFFLTWRLFHALEADFCVDALEETLERSGAP